MAAAIGLRLPSQLSKVLVSRRKARHLTQADVGRRLGLSQNRISQLEADPASISTVQLLSWLAVLGLELQVNEAVRMAPAGKPAAATADGVEW